MFRINKLRLLYILLAIVGFFVLAYFELTGRFQNSYIMFYAFLVVFLNYFFHRAEKNKIMNLYRIYIENLDPLGYIKEYEKYNKLRIQSKDAKTLDKINEAILLLDAGKPEAAHEILMSLTELEPRFRPYLRFWFYNAWFNYFNETEDTKRMRFLLEEIKKLLPQFPPKKRQKMYANYALAKAKLAVKEGKDLDSAESFFSMLVKGDFPKITILNALYQLGIISYKKGNPEVAKRRLLAVAGNGKNLNISRKAQVFLEKMDAETAERNSQ